MKHLIAISMLGILFVGCTEPTIENGCRGDVTEANNKCLRVVNDRQRHQIDSLNYELKLLQQKFHYECTDRKGVL